MASDADFVGFVLEQLEGVDGLTSRKMFGEYALYGEGKVFALVCDNRLFVKQTAGGRAFIGEPVEAPAYPGARPSFLIEERLDEREWLLQLARITIDELPLPKKKKR